jgi:transcriptional regulator GlxA family with amidase domain
MIASFKPDRRRARRRPPLVAVVAFDGVVLGDLSTPCEIFGIARAPDGRPRYEVRVCSLRRKVKSQYVTFDVPWRLSPLSRADKIIIPGIDDLDRVVPLRLLRAIRRAIDRGACVASICTGAFVLARAGALDGLRATTHWLSAAELARRHPGIEVDSDVLYVDNGNVLTSAGAAAGFDLCLHLVRRDFGAGVAADVARRAVMPLERAGGQAQFIVHAPPAPDGTSMGSLLEWIEANLEKPLSLRVLARRASMSTRSLSRHFRGQIGATPAHWITSARVRRAQRLLETTDLFIERIATAVGFASSAVLREHFRRIVGTSPKSHRQSFRLV